MVDVIVRNIIVMKPQFKSLQKNVRIYFYLRYVDVLCIIQKSNIVIQRCNGVIILETTPHIF